MRVGKKMISMVLLCSLVFCLAGCGSMESSKEDGRLKVVATVFAEYDFLKNIAGDKIDLSMLLLPGADSHSFDPTPKDMMKVQEADLFVTIGGESDAWADTIIESIDHDVQTIKLMDCVDEVLEEEIVEGMEEEHDHEESSDAEEGHEHAEEKEFDEHVWTSPKNAIQIVEKLSEKLCSMDKANAKDYQQNTVSYVKKLEELDQKFAEVVQQAKRREIVVADKFPFRYFADAYDLKYYAAFPGCSTQTGASAETIAFLIEKVKEDKIPVVFHMELSSEAMCNTICSETGAKKAQLNAVHNVSKIDFEKGVGYLDLMEENIEVLNEALN